MMEVKMTSTMRYEDRHKLKPHDFAVLDKFDFKYAPTGFKYFNVERDLEGLGLKKIDEKMAWCQMLRKAQDGDAFYATAAEQYCEPGKFLSGHEEIDPIAAGGRIGPPFDIYPDERANRRVYGHLSPLRAGSTFASAFASLDRLTFDPDLLIVTCDNYDQAERLMRATQWDTGDLIQSRMTFVMACNGMFTYPYITGNVNIIYSGIGYGMKLYQLYPPGLPIVSIPWHHIDRVLKNIREMPWTLPGYTDYKEELYKIGHQRLGVDQIV
jgi:uncharacterized protein (DUF169 family)